MVVFLRFVYSPDQATLGSLRAVHAAADGLLAALAGLAHRLDAGGLLAKIEGYLRGEQGVLCMAPGGGRRPAGPCWGTTSQRQEGGRSPAGA